MQFLLAFGLFLTSFADRSVQEQNAQLVKSTQSRLKTVQGLLSKSERALEMEAELANEEYYYEEPQKCRCDNPKETEGTYTCSDGEQGRCGSGTYCLASWKQETAADVCRKAATHRAHNNIAIPDDDGNAVLASCGQKDRRGKVTHGRVKMLNGEKFCVDWNAGTEGNEAVTRACSDQWITCCEEDELLRENDREDLLCGGGAYGNLPTPQCAKDKGAKVGYVDVEGKKCHFADGEIHGCYDEIFCCDEGYAGITFENWGYQCHRQYKTETSVARQNERLIQANTALRKVLESLAN